MIGGLSMTEVIIILGLALLLLGPDQLPQMAKSIGKGLREIRKATDDLKGQFESEIAKFEEEPKRMIAPVPPPPLDPAAVSSPQSTVASSLRFLEADDELRFRQTLLPSVAAKLTPETFADCRAHLARGPVTPDWEVAERTVQDGHLVVRVSMFGKSLTGFHELRGRWLADALWCLPTGLP